MKRSVAIVILVVTAAAPGGAQLAERPGTSESATKGARDLSGLSIKTPRTRLVHTTDPELKGGSMYLQTYDPFLAFKIGKDLTQREMRVRDGVFDGGVALFKGLLSDGETPAVVGNDQVSCGGCHNMPYRDGGAGTNFAKKSGLGRNTPHLYGVGLMEMIAWQVRQKMMQQIDTNRNNFVDESEYSAAPILVEPNPGAPTIDFGRSGDLDADGQPDLNNIFRVWFVDGAGRVVAGATSLDDPGVRGYNFMVEVFGWGEQRFGLNTTLRDFVWDPFNVHMNLQAFDPTTTFDPDNDGFSQVSNAGFQESPIGHIPPDPGYSRNSKDLSIDDPDGDGYINEITEGDLDLAEWYLLNSPRPAIGEQSSETRRGEEVFASLGCESCHVADWRIEAADPDNPDRHRRYLGDLRAFDLDVRYDDATGRLEGKLVRLAPVNAEGRYVRRRASFLVRGIFTDFRHHDMGPLLADMQYDGTLLTKFRTGPLWGNGSGFPWGHDGRSMTLDDIIRRHGGEAQSQREAYEGAPAGDRQAVVSFLGSLLLYSTDLLPTDLDGDGIIEEHYIVAGQDTGVERFNPEWLFRVKGQIEGLVDNPQGVPVRSDALVNIGPAYGLGLAFRTDVDLDGFADVQDECPSVTGYHDGCN